MHQQLSRNFSILLLIASCFISGILSAQTRCLSHELHLKKMAEDANYHKNFEKENIRNFLSEISATSMIDTTVTIPVVVHVLYNTSKQNVSDEEIQSQIDVLNEDFAAHNASSLDVPTDWINLITDSKIRFKLAQRDPSGNNSNGVIRVSSAISEFQIFDPAIYSTALGGSDAWPRSKYLNIWVCQLEGNALGYANFPGSNASQDGIVINYKAFGRNGNANPPYNLGRTCTHEIGHWLILSHIWGDDNNDCSASDFPITQQAIDDTPNQEGPTFRCKRFPELDNCSTTPPGIMYMNFMDYTDDKCMMFYTPGQIFRMRTTLNGIRDSLKISNGHVLPNLYISDVAIDSVLNPVKITSTMCLDPVVRILNNGTSTITDVSIIYGLQSGLQKTFQWSGTLLPGASTQVTLPTLGVNAGTQVMEFRLIESDDVLVNNYISSGFKVNNASVSNCSGGNLIAYPNPVTSQQGICIKSQNKQSQLSWVSVYNALGQLLSEKRMMINPGDGIPIDLTNYRGGVYFVNVEGDLYSESVRFIYIPSETTTEGPENCN
ncbi:MAG: T9SS type A sorting domain-containing protein [Bacteroidetes bacterium]|nr:T9SS type A sorting domain-containing protein [Bacteroidota bacterium]